VLHRPVREQLRGEPERERGLPGAGRGHGEEVLRALPEIGDERPALPGPE
jgi:hypothetical protein